MAPRGDGDYPSQASDLCGAHLLAGLIAGLVAGGVCSPPPDRAIVPERQAVVGASGDGPDLAEAGHLDRGVVPCGGAIPKLGAVVSSPGPHRAVRAQGQAVIVSA